MNCEEEVKNPSQQHFCGQCIKFGTVKCSERFGTTEIGTKPKVIHSWAEFIEFLYDCTSTHNLRLPTTNLVFRSDVACGDFVPGRGRCK